MTTEDEVMRLLRRADPDRGRADRPSVDGTQYLAALRTRSTAVTLIDIGPAPTQPERRHRWPIVAAAAAVVAIVVGAVILAAREDSEPPVPADTTVAPDATTAVEEVARGFLDAYVANDADQALTYLAGTASTAFWGSAEELRGEIAWDAATGFKTMIKECEPTDDDPEAGITLRCGYDFHMLGSDAIGNGPYRDGYWELTVRDGEIVAAAYEVAQFDPWHQEMWVPFRNWIKAEHPDDVLVMYTDSSAGDRRFTEEALQLWEQRTQEYVQTVLTSREAYAAAVGAICATQAARLGELTVPAEGALDQVATKHAAEAAILKQSLEELRAVDAPLSTDMTAYQDFRNKFPHLRRIAEDSAEAATAGDSVRLAELEAEYHEVRQAMSSGPAGSGLEECLASLPS